MRPETLVPLKMDDEIGRAREQSAAACLPFPGGTTPHPHPHGVRMMGRRRERPPRARPHDAPTSKDDAA